MTKTKSKMKPKERVLTALAHQEPDRVPIDYTGANADIYRRLIRHFNLAEDDHNGLLEALNVDFRSIALQYTGPEIHPDIPDRNIDKYWGYHTRWIENESGGYWDFCDFPLKDADLETVQNWPMPDPDHFDYESVLPQCEKHKDYCLVFGDPGTGDIINSTGMIRTMEQVLMDLALDNEPGLEFFHRKSKTQLEIAARVLEAAKGQINLLWIGEDLGTQNGPILSLDMYRKHIKPIQKQFADLAKQYNIPVMIHCCGSSSWAFDDFIEIGIHVVDTLQPEAVNMSPQYLKETYGDKLTFHGSISTAGPLAYGTVDQAVRNLEETLEIMKPGGGYVMAPTHMLQDNTPTENAVQVFQKAVELGRYK